MSEITRFIRLPWVGPYRLSDFQIHLEFSEELTKRVTAGGVLIVNGETTLRFDCKIYSNFIRIKYELIYSFDSIELH